MPYVVRNKLTDEVFACMLINTYDIPFYGAKFWDDPDTAQAEKETFLQEQNVASPIDWEVYEVEEHTLKLLNVKLANKPSRKVFIDVNGQIHSR